MRTAVCCTLDHCTFEPNLTRESHAYDHIDILDPNI